MALFSRIQYLPLTKQCGFALMLMLFCQNLWAIQEAIVITDEAVIYADEQMTSPVGFVRRGRKLKVGEIARNRAQVYPLLVSGKMAYIRVRDVSTEKESLGAARLSAERFQKAARPAHQVFYALSYYSFMSEASIDKTSENSDDKDFNWNGISLRGVVSYPNRWEFHVLTNIMQTDKMGSTFRVWELGAGGFYRLIDWGRLLFRASLEVLAVPFASYSFENQRVNGYGFTANGGLNLGFRLTENLGLEAYAGPSYTQLTGFKAKEPIGNLSLAFLGTRIGFGINYRFD
jgi:hypothetical protein